MSWPLAITDHQASGVLEIVWEGGAPSRLSHALLRARCRCAACEQRFRQVGGHPPLDEAVRLTAIRPIGDKALNLVFSDGHDRGLYPWAYLRELDGAPSTLRPERAPPCRPSEPSGC